LFDVLQQEHPAPGAVGWALQDIRSLQLVNHPFIAPSICIAHTIPILLRVNTLPNAGSVAGMGIRRGVTLIVGGGFHGKSTLLQALQVRR